MKKAIINPLLISLFIEAQDQGDSLRTKANILTLSITQLLIRDLQLSYDRFITPRSSLEFTGGIKILKKTEQVYRGQLYLDLYLPYENSYYLSLAFRLNFAKARQNVMGKPTNQQPYINGFYLGLKPYYRYNTYTVQPF